MLCKSRLGKWNTPQLSKEQTGHPKWPAASIAFDPLLDTEQVLRRGMRIVTLTDLRIH